MTTKALYAAVWLLLSLAFLEKSHSVEATPAPAEPDATFLTLLQEPLLDGRGPDRPAQEIRLLMFRSFHSTVSIRAYITDDGPQLRAVRFSRDSESNPGRVDFENVTPLSKEYWTQLITLSSVEKARNPLAGVPREVLDALETTDGSTWVLEVREGDHYSRAEVRNPTWLLDLKLGRRKIPEIVNVPNVVAFAACCRHLLRFAPMDEDRIY